MLVLSQLRTHLLRLAASGGDDLRIHHQTSISTAPSNNIIFTRRSGKIQFSCIWKNLLLKKRAGTF